MYRLGKGVLMLSYKGHQVYDSSLVCVVILRYLSSSGSRRINQRKKQNPLPGKVPLLPWKLPMFPWMLPWK